jgi:HEAT repeat protein
MTRLLWLLAALLLGAPQEPPASSPRELIRELSSADPVRRDGATARLKSLGEAARKDLEEGSKSADPEVAARTGALLRRLAAARLLPPGIESELPGVLDRLSAPGRSAWLEVLVELAPRRFKTGSSERAFEAIALECFRGLSKPEQKKQLCETLQDHWSRRLVSAAAGLLRDESPEVRGAAAMGLGKAGARQAEPELTALLKDPDPSTRIAASKSLLAIFGVDAIPLLLPLLQDPNVDVREEVVTQLWYLPMERGIPLGPKAVALIPFLRDPESSIRMMAAKVLGDARIGQAATPLVDRLGDSDEEVRRAAAEALGSLGVAETAPSLELALGDRQAEVRQAAAHALGALRVRTTIPALLRRLGEQEPEASVRSAALEALGNLKAPEARADARRLLTDPDPGVRMAAGTLLFELGDEASVTPLTALLRVPESTLRRHVDQASTPRPPGWIEPAILPLLEDPEPSTRWWALSTLVSLGNPKTVPAFLKLLEDPDRTVRQQAMYEAWHFPEAIAPLRALLGHQDASTRTEAATALVEVSGKNAVKDLAPLLEDPSSQMRIHILNLLGPLGRDEDVPALIRLLGDPDETVRQQAAPFLRIRGSEVRPALEALVKTGPDIARRAAQGLLADLDPDAHRRAAIAELDSPDEARRTEALDSLARLDAPEATAPIEAILKNPDPNRRSWAAHYLGTRLSRTSAPLLRPLLRDPDPEVRLSALEALELIGDRESIPIVLGLLDDPSTGIVSKACRFLAVLGCTEAISRLEDLLADSDVTADAVDALALLASRSSARKFLPYLGLGTWDMFSDHAPVALGLGTLDARDLLPELRTALRDRSAAVRIDAAIAMGEFGCQEARPELVGLLEDPNSEVAAAAADALGRLGAREAIPKLRQLLQEPLRLRYSGASLRESAIHALVRLEAREAIPEFFLQLERPGISVVVAALKGLEHFHDPETLPHLVEVLNSEGWPFKAVDGFVSRKDRGRVPAVVDPRMLGGLEDTFINFSVPTILASFDARDYLPDLERLLTLGTGETRLAAAGGLARMGSSQGVAILLRHDAAERQTELFSLNALRAPALWTRMRNTLFPRTTCRRRRELWQEMARVLGVGLELPAAAEFASPALLSRRDVREHENCSSLLDFFENDLAYSSFEVILEPDRIRVLPSREAIAVWQTWWRAQQNK